MGLNKKNTRRKVSNGLLSISVWTWLLVSNLSKNHSVFSPFLKKNVCSQKLPIRPTEKNFSEPISVRLHLSVNNLPNPKVNVMLTSNFITTPVPSVTTLMIGSKRTRIQSITPSSNSTKNHLSQLCKPFGPISYHQKNKLKPQRKLKPVEVKRKRRRVLPSKPSLPLTRNLLA